MMKFLHLSDLHIGKSVNGFSMLEEQKNAFRQIVEYIQAERPKAVLIAGDIYDRAVPGVEAVRVFDDFLTTLAALDVAVLLISGNHDSPERIAYANRLLADKGLYLCGNFNGELQKVTLTDDVGEVHFWLLPFIRPSMLRGHSFYNETDSYGECIATILNDSDIDYSARNVLLSHQFYTSPGVALERSESEINPVGGLDAVDAGLVAKFDYVALGHLHGPQRLGSEHIRYAGSPIKYSFSEWRQKKSVTLVELSRKGEISVTALPLNPIHDMREIKGPLDVLLSEEIVTQGNREDYLRVILTDEDEIIDPMGKLRSVYPNVMALDFENTRTSIEVSGITADGERTEALSPYDLFCEFFLEASGAVMSEEQADLIRELLDTEVTA